jgi:SAM-dependent methyltransferase
MEDDAAETQVRVWTSGDYALVARQLLAISIETVEAIGIQPGDRVLDVGVGNGNAALEAARRGGVVTGIDLTPAQIDRARRRAVEEGVDLDLRVGDAEHLEVDDATFDVVLSVMGVIFAPDHARALAEMARAARPGATVALTAWAEGGWSYRWRERAAGLVPAASPGSPMPDAWGDADEVARRFAAAGLEATVETRPFAWQYPSEAEALETFVTSAGPYVQFMAAATRLGRGDEAMDLLRAVVSDCNQATDGSCRLPGPYLLAVART